MLVTGETMKIYNKASGQLVGQANNATPPHFVGQFPWGRVPMQWTGTEWHEQTTGVQWVPASW